MIQRLTILLLALFLLSSALIAKAQQVPAAAYTATAAPDTVAALHRLFAAKRQRNKRFIAGTLGVTAVGGVVIGTSPSTWDGLDQAVLGLTIIALSILALTVEAYTAVNYNKKSEQQAIDSFQAHQLPRHLKRQLKARYFPAVVP